MYADLDHNVRNGLVVLIRIGNCLLELSETYYQADMACQLITEAKRAYLAYNAFRKGQDEKS